jgi:NAD/NADP transhydrogenase beta subunit
VFNVEQRASVTDEGRPLAPMVIWLFNTYAGLTTGLAGFVLNRTELVVVGLVLVMSGSALAHVVAKVMSRSPVGAARRLSER